MEISANIDRILTLQGGRPLSEMPPKTVVLQPRGALLGEVKTAFEISLEQAIVEAEAVIVDLLWVTRIDAEGISVLLAGMKQAQAIGKCLSFLAMDATTRTALDAVWAQQRETEASPQADLFTPNFEQFLDNHKNTQVSP
ncbi:hypothetical protein C7B65_10880 [Phormidesmis priestleyi ULC007]|uniref:STAS domain-containing protein n=1 Tax=Phormidesmis priestleyi ULC007 TaxID=1920490 RepID=A0A2T1DFZ7_9CYAN|nr:STAS domain-containing protein [Phormidesmis priestleyi]PSB19419.1 hypothetical protein C7B65_10880 [Phormidesmis priestleyi ULC007]PZO53140.1 MAG: hypothetical protein DCF14_05870 [Phormidesmis priestleyi]